MTFDRFLLGTDLHGDRQSASTVKAFLEFDAIWKPDIRIFGGDLIDLRALRKGLERRVARAVGCLCALEMDYNSRQPNTLRQAHGWAYGVINRKTGAYHVWQAEEIEGKWLLPTDLKAIG